MPTDLKVYRLLEVSRQRTVGYYRTLSGAKAAGEREERKTPLVPECRMEWVQLPGLTRRWDLFVFAPNQTIPDTTDYLITEINVIDED